MTSKQINFFILPTDLIIIENILRFHNAIFIKQPIYNCRNIFSDYHIQYPLNENEFDKLFLTNQEFVDKIIFEKIDNQGYSLVNELYSYVIEFSRGGFLYDQKRLERARLYCRYSYYNESKIVNKDKKFLEWSNRIFSVIKKEMLIMDKSKGVYISKNAQQWILENDAVLHQSGLFFFG